MLVEPDKVRDPARMRVAGQEDGVVDLVIVQVLQGPVPVGLVAIPGIVIQRVLVAVRNRLVDAGEH